MPTYLSKSLEILMCLVAGASSASPLSIPAMLFSGEVGADKYGPVTITTFVISGLIAGILIYGFSHPHVSFRDRFRMPAFVKARLSRG